MGAISLLEIGYRRAPPGLTIAYLFRVPLPLLHMAVIDDVDIRLLAGQCPGTFRTVATFWGCGFGSRSPK